MTNRPHLHFMGVGGVSMSGLARWYLREGYQVSGCDSAQSPTVQRLRSLGIPVHQGHHPDHLTPGTVLVKSMAVSESQPEVGRASELGLEVRSRIDLLRDLFQKRRAVAITGSHGKSTTTGMIATIFVKLGLDPSVQLGADLQLIGGNMRYGEGPTLVAEVDESDPGFALLPAHLAVITNLEDDHVAGGYDERRNYHASLEDLLQGAQAFAAKAEGLVYSADWAHTVKLFAAVAGASTFGLSRGADYQITDLALEAAGSRFDLNPVSGRPQPVRLSVPGQHNALNAAAALAVADRMGLDLSEAAEALETFPGVGRRWQRWDTSGEVLIIDDYAHHPTEVAATLSTARQTGRRVRAVLQPHRWVRTALHWPALADAAALADEVLVLDIYSAGERPIPGVTPELIVERITKSGKDAHYHHTLKSASDYLSTTLRANDLVITLGAGDVWQVAEALARGGPGEG